MIGLPDRDRRRSRRHSRSDGADARHHAEARARPRPARPHRRQRQPADPEAGHRLPVAADGGSGESPSARASGCASCCRASTTSTSTSSPNGTRTTRRCCRSAIAASRRRSRRPSATAASGAPPSPRPASTPTFYIFRDRSHDARAAVGHHRRRHEDVVLPGGVRQGAARGMDAAAEAAEGKRASLLPVLTSRPIAGRRDRSSCDRVLRASYSAYACRIRSRIRSCDVASHDRPQQREAAALAVDRVLPRRERDVAAVAALRSHTAKPISFSPSSGPS